MRGKLKKALFWTILIILSVACVEVILHMTCFVEPRIDRLLSGDTARAIPDPRLGHRPDPTFPEHDSWGFRNPAVPDKATVVVFGDSQTYGTGVRPEYTWPRKLESLIKTNVYSIAFGGWGPVHYYSLIDKAFSLDPKLIIMTFYSGNDLHDAFHAPYTLNLAPELKNADSAVITTIKREEEEEQGHPVRKRTEQPKKPPWLIAKDKLFRYSKILSVLRLYKSILPIEYSIQPEWESVKANALRSDGLETFDQGSIRTVLTPKKRLKALNLKNTRLQEGLRISLEAMKRTQDLCRRKGVRLVVCYIPTKELVLLEQINASNTKMSANYQDLVENETLLVKRLSSFCSSLGIPFISTVSGLREMIRKGEQPYRIDSDGHPNKLGHKVIAERITQWIKEDAPELKKNH